MIASSPADVRTPIAAQQPLPTLRLVFLLLGGLSLLAGLNAALLLLDLPAPLTGARLSEMHGELMVFGFLGTVISLERAVAARRWWAYLAPATLGLGALSLLSVLPVAVGQTLIVVGLAVLNITYVELWQRARADEVAIQALGAVLGLGAAMLLLGGVGFPQTMPWLVGFVALTIGGERVELARVGSPDPRLRQAATYLSVGVALSAGLALTLPATGVRVFAVLTLALVGVLVTFDVARKTIRMTGLPRFSAACILTGYFWLALAATTWLWAGPLLEGPGYDLVTHSVFLGFALSMVMGHAPIIFPAVVRRPIPYHWSMWAAFILLQVSLFARLVLGDLREVPWTWQVGGALNVAAIVVFLLVTVTRAVKR